MEVDPEVRVNHVIYKPTNPTWLARTFGEGNFDKRATVRNSKTAKQTFRLDHHSAPSTLVALFW